MTDSPFLSGTHKQFAWDSTSLGWFKECPRKYYLSMIRGLRGRAVEQSVHLRWGGLYHSALEKYDRLTFEGIERAQAIRDVIRYLLTETWDADKGEPTAFEHNTKTRPNLVRSVLWYLEFFRNDNAATVRLSNGRPAVELSFRLPIDDGIILCGHLDRVVHWPQGGGDFVMDRKTTSSALGSYYFDQFKPDNQMSLYSFAGAAILSAPIKGVIIDAVQVGVTFSRFARGLTYRSQPELDEWLDETYRWIQKVHTAVDEDFWPANDKSCHHYGGCVFRKVCGAAPQVREQILESDYEVRPWNPLESDR
jgi:hypothetical protein